MGESKRRGKLDAQWRLLVERVGELGVSRASRARPNSSHFGLIRVSFASHFSIFRRVFEVALTWAGIAGYHRHRERPIRPPGDEGIHAKTGREARIN